MNTSVRVEQVVYGPPDDKVIRHETVPYDDCECFVGSSGSLIIHGENGLVRYIIAPGFWARAKVIREE